VTGYFCPILTELQFSRHIFNTLPNTKFHENPFSGSHADTCGQTDMTKKMDAIRDYANMPKTA